MLITFIAQVLGLQILAFLIIAFVLLKILDRQLTESAVHQFEVMFAKELDGSLEEIVVVVCNKISVRTHNRIQSAAFKKFGREIPLTIRQDTHMRGGLIIKLNQLTLDYSLMNRLRDSGLVK